MIGTRIFSGSTFEDLAGYARAVVLPDPGGDWILVSGTTGFDYRAMTISADAAEQTRQCFTNIEEALRKAGSSLEDAVRINIFLAEADDFQRIGPIVGDYMRPSRAANTTVVTGLVDKRMKVEIEVTARKKA